jgi:7,8-dihydroneopterin aldolase/epimerase/oxygenase
MARPELRAPSSTMKHLAQQANAQSATGKPEFGARKPKPASEWIEIHELRLSTRLGVPEKERATPQEVLINLRYRVSKSFGELEDRIENTIDYGEVVRACAHFAKVTESQLLESFSARLADFLVEQFPFTRLQLETRKYALNQASYVSARTERSCAKRLGVRRPAGALRQRGARRKGNKTE